MNGPIRNFKGKDGRYSWFNNQFSLVKLKSVRNPQNMKIHQNLCKSAKTLNDEAEEEDVEWVECGHGGGRVDANSGQHGLFIQEIYPLKITNTS